MPADDFFELDFLDVESPKSGDAIPLRYRLEGQSYIHVVDGGFQDCGSSVIEHIRRYYADPPYAHNVVVTHPDGDHAGGLRTVLEEIPVGALWMLRPWKYVDELMPAFERFSSREGLEGRLREIYSNIDALEEIADARRIPIYEPRQGTYIGPFLVLAPTIGRYLQMVIQSDRTPESGFPTLEAVFRSVAARIVVLAGAGWGAETFSPEETSAENEMSVVQYAQLCGHGVLLTGDTGRAGLAEAADYGSALGLQRPTRFQAPHHGSRRNVSTELLDRWLGPRLSSPLPPGQERTTAIISSAREDTDHPRKAVVRALIHRGAKVFATEGRSLRFVGGAAPARSSWTPVIPLEYPDEQEE